MFPRGSGGPILGLDWSLVGSIPTISSSHLKYDEGFEGKQRNLDIK